MVKRNSLLDGSIVIVHKYMASEMM